MKNLKRIRVWLWGGDVSVWRFTNKTYISSNWHSINNQWGNKYAERKETSTCFDSSKDYKKIGKYKAEFTELIDISINSQFVRTVMTENVSFDV